MIFYFLYNRVWSVIYANFSTTSFLLKEKRDFCKANIHKSWYVSSPPLLRSFSFFSSLAATGALLLSYSHNLSVSSSSPACRCPSPAPRTYPSTPPGPRALVCPPPPAWPAPCVSGRATGPGSSQKSDSPVPTSPGWSCSSRSGSPQELKSGPAVKIISRCDSQNV